MSTRKRIPQYLLYIFVMLFITHKNYAQVGIGTSDPKTSLDVNGALSLREGPDLILSNGNSNEIQLNSEPYSFYRITGPTASFGIKRIRATANADGHFVTLVNFTDEEMKIRHNVGSPTNVRKIFCPSEADIILKGKYASITLQYNTALSGWVVVNSNYVEEEKTIDSVTLEADYNLSPTSGFTDVPGMTLTFVAQKTSILLSLTGSGGSSDIAMGIIDFTIINTATSAILGGTHANLTTFDDVFGISPAWSLSFSKLLTGLVIGDSYTLKVQALLDVSVTSGIASSLDMNASTEPFHHHLTLSAIP